MSNGNGNGSVAAWLASYIVAPLLIIGVSAIAAWAWSLQIGHASQETTISVHESRIDWHDKTVEKMDAKLDRILERLGAK